MGDNPLQRLKSKQESIMNKASIVAFFGMEIAPVGWVGPIGLDPDVWMQNHGVDPFESLEWDDFPTEAKAEVEEAIEKLELLANDDKIAIITHVDRVFIAIVPGMVFLPYPIEIGPGLGMDGISEGDFAHENFLTFFHDRGFDVTPVVRDESPEGYLNTFLAKNATIFGLPSMDGGN